jgi:hypothetical protein
MRHEPPGIHYHGAIYHAKRTLAGWKLCSVQHGKWTHYRHIYTREEAERMARELNRQPT